jgi:hypothetical protein
MGGYMATSQLIKMALLARKLVGVPSVRCMGFGNHLKKFTPKYVEVIWDVHIYGGWSLAPAPDPHPNYTIV